MLEFLIFQNLVSSQMHPAIQVRAVDVRERDRTKVRGKPTSWFVYPSAADSLDERIIPSLDRPPLSARLLDAFDSDGPLEDIATSSRYRCNQENSSW